MVIREIVTGDLLGHSLNKNVTVFGKIESVDPNGKSFQVKTVDNVVVTVNLTVPLDDLLEGYVEVQGVCQSRNVINAEDYIPFSEDLSQEFDSEGHNKLCALLQTVPDVFKVCEPNKIDEDQIMQSEN